MKAIYFPGCNVTFGENQPQYNPLPAMKAHNPQGELFMCFELTDEEIEEIRRTKRIYYSRLTFGQICHNCFTPQGFLPMKLTVEAPEEVVNGQAQN